MGSRVESLRVYGKSLGGFKFRFGMFLLRAQSDPDVSLSAGFIASCFCLLGLLGESVCAVQRRLKARQECNYQEH